MNGDTIKLGLMPPLTGLVGIYGSEISRAGQIACQEINANGGVLGRQLELVIEDDASLPESAVTAATKLTDQHKCTAIIGNLLSNSRIAVAYSVAEPRKVPYLNFSFYEGSIRSRYFFHFAALPNQQIDRMIPYMREKYGPRVFFAGNNYEWPRGSIDAAKRSLKSVGGEVVGELYCPIGVDDKVIEDLLDQLTTKSPDVFVPYFAGEDQVKLLTRFTERGLKERMAVVMGHYDEMMASTLSPEVREGFYSSNSYFMSVDTDENRHYLEQLRKQSGVSGIWPQGNGILTNFGEGTYVCVKAFAEAANIAGTLDSEALVDALKRVSVSTPQGTVQMDPGHQHARVNTYLSRCGVDGAFEIIEKFGALDPVLPERYEHQLLSDSINLEEDYRLQARVLEQMSEAVFLVSSSDNRIVYSNAGALRMFGFSKQEMQFQSIERLYRQQTDGPNHYQQTVQVLQQKGEWRGEVKLCKKEGESVWCSITITSFTHHDPTLGEVWLWVLNDVSGRKRIEDELALYHSQLEALVEQRADQLQESEARLSQVLSSSPVVIYTCETHGDYAATYISENVKQLFGFEPQQFLEDSGFWARGIHPDDAPRVFSELVQLFEYGRHSHEYRFRMADGRYIWVHDELKLQYDKQGNPVEIVGYWADITDRKHADEKLQAKTEQLETVISSAALVLWSNDKDGVFTLSEGKALESMSLKPGQMVGQSVYDIYADYPEIIDATRRVLSGESFVTEANVGDRCFESHYTPRVNQQGEVVGSIGVAVDITERKKFELEMLAAREEADRANMAKSEFLSSMSHELRTPMNAIIGFGQLLENDDALTGDQKDCVQEMLKGGHHLLELINEVLDLAKVESGHLVMSLEPVALSLMVNECMTMVGTLADKRSIRLESRGLLESLVRADRVRLKQALLNLLSNAIKYNREGGNVIVDVQKSSNENFMRISVIDNGFGISDEHQAELFEPFNRLGAKNSEIEGTGIGLTLTRQVVELMNGKLGWKSERGAGSTFWIDLPVEVGTHVPDEIPAKVNYTKITSSPVLGQRTVLYIEDNPANLKLMEQLMKRQEQIHLLVAHTPELGLELAKSVAPELILLDINLPGINGYQLLEIFKSDQDLRNIPVIAITANAMPGDVKRGKKLGFADYVTKPIHVETFFNAVDRCLSKVDDCETPVGPDLVGPE